MIMFNVTVDLGELLMLIRRRRGLTTAKLADRSGLPLERVIDIVECGDHLEAHISELSQIAAALGFELDVKLTMQDEEE